MEANRLTPYLKQLARELLRTNPPHKVAALLGANIDQVLKIKH